VALAASEEVVLEVEVGTAANESMSTKDQVPQLEAVAANAKLVHPGLPAPQVATAVQALLGVLAIPARRDEMEPCCLLRHRRRLAKSVLQDHPDLLVRQDQRVFPAHRVTPARPAEMARLASLVLQGHKALKARQVCQETRDRRVTLARRSTVLHQDHPDLLDHLVLRVHPVLLEGTVRPADPVQLAHKAIPERRAPMEFPVPPDRQVSVVHQAIPAVATTARNLVLDQVTPRVRQIIIIATHIFLLFGGGVHAHCLSCV